MSGFANKSVDPAIVARARHGDMKAHEIIFRTLGNPVYTLARRMTGSAENADDVLQETFVEVIRSIHSYRQEASLATWVRRIAVSKCLMYMRSAWNRRGTLAGDMTELGAVAWSGIAEDADSHHRAESPMDLRMDLESALEHLTPVSRVVVWLHDVEGYTHREIGTMMEMTTSFSKSQLARAHQRLQEVLAADVPVMPSSGSAMAPDTVDQPTPPACESAGKPMESEG